MKYKLKSKSVHVVLGISFENNEFTCLESNANSFAVGESGPLYDLSMDCWEPIGKQYTQQQAKQMHEFIKELTQEDYGLISEEADELLKQLESKGDE